MEDNATKGMKKLSALAVAAGVVGAVGGCSANLADSGEYPSGTVQFVVPYDAGGSSDPLGRKFAELLGQELGTEIQVVNRPGGSETVGISSVIVNNEGNGHHLALATAGGLITQPLLFGEELEYSGADDWTDISFLTRAPQAIVVGADSPYETLDDLVEAAEEDPGNLSIGTTGQWDNTSLVASLLEDEASISWNIAPFNGGASEAVTAAMDGRIDAAIVSASGQLGLIEAGELEPIAVSGTETYGALPEVPSLGELGYEVPLSTDYVVIAPPGIPEEVATQLSEASQAVLTSEEFEDWAASNGYDPVAGGPDEVAEWVTETTATVERGAELLNESN